MSASQRIGRYELLDRLGAGAMGQVFRARHAELQRVVALKLIKDPDPTRRERIAREARALSRLQHPGIVPVLEIGEHDGQPFLVMALVEGEPLDAVLDREGPLPAERCLHLGLALARALEHAHDQGVLHRDLKPSNVLLDADGDPVLVDFGLAKLSDASQALTRTGAMVGTPFTMAPEQIHASEPDARTDVYGLGATLYMLLTGEPPCAGDGLPGLIAAILDQVPMPPSQLADGVDARVDAVVLRCLEKRPEDRFASAGALAAALEDALAPPAPEAHPERWLFAAVAVLTLVLLAVVARRGGDAPTTAEATGELDAIPSPAPSPATPAPAPPSPQEPPPRPLPLSEWRSAIQELDSLLTAQRELIDRRWRDQKTRPWAAVVQEGLERAAKARAIATRLTAAPPPPAPEDRAVGVLLLIKALSHTQPTFNRATLGFEATGLHALVSLVEHLGGAERVRASEPYRLLQRRHPCAPLVGVLGRLAPDDPETWRRVVEYGFQTRSGQAHLLAAASRVAAAAPAGDDRLVCQLLLIRALADSRRPEHDAELVRIAARVLTPARRSRRGDWRLRTDWVTCSRPPAHMIGWGHLDLARSLLRLGRHEASLRALGHARAEGIEVWAAPVRVGVLASAGRLDEAERLLERSLPSKPDPWRDRWAIAAALDLGRTHGRPERARQALRSLNRALAPAGWWVQLADAELAGGPEGSLQRAAFALYVAAKEYAVQRQPERAQAAREVERALRAAPTDQRRARLAPLLDVVDLRWFTLGS